MIIEQITLTPFQQQTRVLGCEGTRRAVCETTVGRERLTNPFLMGRYF